MDIRVYHYEDTNSNKYWAIDLNATSTNTYKVWYGGAGKTLVSKEVSGDPYHRIRQKENKGYVFCTELSVDESSMTIDLKSNLPDNNLPISNERFLYFQIFKPKTNEDQSLLEQCISNFCEEIKHNVQSESKDLYLELINSHCYKAFVNFKKQNLLSNDISYSDGPIAGLLLMGLSRKLIELGNDNLAINIVTDDNKPFPYEFKNMENLLNDMYLDKSSVQTNQDMPLSKDFYLSKKTAIIFGCIEAPIDMSTIQSDINAAFF